VSGSDAARRRVFSCLRAGLYATAAPWFVVCALDTRQGFRAWLLLVAVAVVLAWSAQRFAPAGLSPRGARALDLAAWSLLSSLLAVEVGLRLWGALGDPPPWLDLSPDPVRYRLDPEREWLGTRPNSHGFYDQEFAPVKTPGVVRVAALGDSYTVGMVPFRQGYLRRVEAALRGAVEVLNLGVVHTAVPEYEQVLRTEALPLAPDLVLVGLYVGNDVRRDPPRGPFSSAGSKAVMAARVLALLWGAGGPYRQSLPTEVVYAHAEPEEPVERPILSVEAHLDGARKHAERLLREPRDERMREAWRDTEAALRQLVATCREVGVPIVATIAPDEIQVDDALFERVVEASGERREDFDRDYPNRRLSALLASLDVPVLDLTPALRAAETLAPTYHQRGVHWNAHGNAAAADAVAGWLAARIAALGSHDPTLEVGGPAETEPAEGGES
jgi:lysophospholipase L1-like esterase